MNHSKQHTQQRRAVIWCACPLLPQRHCRVDGSHLLPPILNLMIIPSQFILSSVLHWQNSLLDMGKHQEKLVQLGDPGVPKICNQDEILPAWQASQAITKFIDQTAHKKHQAIHKWRKNLTQWITPVKFSFNRSLSAGYPAVGHSNSTNRPPLLAPSWPRW